LGYHGAVSGIGSGNQIKPHEVIPTFTRLFAVEQPTENAKHN
jgi:hypothetical protein